MTVTLTVTQRGQSVTRDTRARVRLCHCVTRDKQRDVTVEDRDATPPGIASRSKARCGVEEEKQAGAKAPENLAAARTAAHKAKLATDPRFAGWVGLMADGDPDPAIGQAAQRLADERRELMRRAKYAFLCHAQDNPEADPAEIAEARQFLADHPPLQRPLGTGEPA